MIEIKDKKLCSGCTACATVCPQKCIEITADKEGFFYPNVRSEKCINCHLCENICPIIGINIEGAKSAEIYGGQNRNEQVRRISTGGGVFEAIAKWILKYGGAVWAAGFNDRAEVVHKKASTEEEVISLCGSKYVQSNLGDCFEQIRKYVRNNTAPALFVGTPCQVAGLMHIITPEEKEQIYTIDLVCYGVPSSGLYLKWIDYLGNKYGSKVKNVVFRDKKYGYAGVNVKVNLENGTYLEDISDVKSYGKTMFSHIGLRPICYTCPFKGEARLSDFTIGDMWEIGNYSKDMDDDAGTTSLQVNSSKGKSLLNEISDYVKLCHIGSYEGEKLEEIQRKERRYFQVPEKRKLFFEDASAMEYGQLINKYLPDSFKERLKTNFKPIFIKMPFSKLLFRAVKKRKIKSSRRKCK